MESHGSQSTILRVILDREIVKEICTVGVVSKADRVASTASNIIVYLLSLREERLWPDLRDQMLQWLAFIEVCDQYHVRSCWVCG